MRHLLAVGWVSSVVCERPRWGRSRTWRFCIPFATAAMVCFGGAVPAHADNILPLSPKVCVGTGALYVAKAGDTFTWSLSGFGPCEELFPVDPSNPSVGLPIGALETVSFQGTGTSKTLGFCSLPKAYVRDLVINVTAVFHSLLTGEDVTVHQVWSAPLATFPVVTAFLITGDQGSAGAGVVSTRTFLGCGNAGAQPSAVFTWAETLPPSLGGP